MSTSATELAIDLRDVAKTYRGKVHALNGVEMHVRRGEIFGLLGPNGAGKSTLVKIMMTVVRPTRGAGSVLGQPLGDKPTLARVGYLPENHRFPRYLTGRQTLEFFGALAGVDRSLAGERATQLLTLTRMSDWADRKVATYSKGMMQRIGLAQAMMNDPELILLDEPTDGVDPVGRREILDVLHQLRRQGKTVFINSHALGELESLCDRVAILVRGQVARQGRVDELTFARQRYEIEFESPEGLDARSSVIRALPAQWSPPAPPTFGARAVDRGALASGQWLELDGPILRVGAVDAKEVQPVLDALRQANLVIRRLQLMRASLEDLFLEAVTDPASGLRAGPGAQLADAERRGFSVSSGLRAGPGARLPANGSGERP